MDQQTLDRVVAQTRRLLPRHVDHEQVAIDILILSWQNHVEQPSVSFIQYRCYDVIRKLKQEEKTLHSYVPPESSELEERASDQQNSTEVVGKLVMTLTPFERKVIWYRFYQEISLAEISQRLELPVNTIRSTLEMALYKMRNVGEGE